MKKKLTKAKAPKAPKAASGQTQDVNLWRYTSAVYDSNRGWNPFINTNSADVSIETDLWILRRQAEELNANYPIIKSIVNGITSAVCGNGFHISVDTKDNALNDSLEKHIRRWTSTPLCDAANRRNLSELTEVQVRAWILYGEAFSLLVKSSQEEKYQTKIRVLDPNKVRNPGNQQSNTQDPFLSYGIQKDKYGRLLNLFYEIDANKTIKKPFYDKEGNLLVQQLYRPMFPEQTHGEPLLASIYRMALDLGTYIRSEVQAASNASQINVIAKLADPAAKVNQLNAQYNNLNPKANPIPTVPQNPIRQVQGINPGVQIVLNPEETLEQFKLERPGTLFIDFVNKISGILTAACGFSYEHIFRSFSDSNYASARISILKSQEEASRWQDIVIAKFIRPALIAFVKELESSGEIDFGSLDIDDVIDAIKIVKPKSVVLDPQKEYAAAKLAVDSNFTTLQQVTDSLGFGAYDGILQQRGREFAQAKELGLVPEAIPNEAPAPTPGSPPNVYKQVGKPPSAGSTRS